MLAKVSFKSDDECVPFGRTSSPGRRARKEEGPLVSPTVSPTVKTDRKKPLSPKRVSSFRLLFAGKEKNKTALADSADMEDDDDDPVMALFKSRTTQRVRFCLEPSEPKYEKQVDEDERPSSNSNALNVKRFMNGALFGSRNGTSGRDMNSDIEAEVAKEIETAKKNSEMVWESTNTRAGAEVVRTKFSMVGKRSAPEMTLSFTEDNDTRASVIKLLNKARRAQFAYFRYQYAVNCCMKALELLNNANYPNDHPTVVKTLQSLNNAYHALSSYQNSANIVRMGIRYEDTGDLIKALKMYTIAYRIRRDNLSRNHPSLAVLLNMLAGIQVKRGELDEAMEIYELSLKDGPMVLDEGSGSGSQEEIRPTTNNFLARSVTYREMGTIHERWGEVKEAMERYHQSLACVAQYKGISVPSIVTVPTIFEPNNAPSSPKSITAESEEILLDLESVHLSSSFAKHTEVVKANSNEDDQFESGGMELFIGSRKREKSKSSLIKTSSSYDAFFPPSLHDDSKKNKKVKNENGFSHNKKADDADVDVALTLHQIGQLHREEGEFNLALSAYTVSLRGMRHALGGNHPNVAAILGNIGNLQKEMGDMDAAFDTYQRVLAIESDRLGLSHPDVCITLHNIATIDAARGNHEDALALYKQVLDLQKRLFGEDHPSLAVTSACMGDVYERIGDLNSSVESFEEAVRIKTIDRGRHSVEVARLLHKLGKLAVSRGDYHLAESYIARAVLIYRLKKLADDDKWLVEANRDAADVDAAIALGRGVIFEC